MYDLNTSQLSILLTLFPYLFPCMELSFLRFLQNALIYLGHFTCVGHCVKVSTSSPFPVTKIWYPVKIQFLSFTCENMTVVVATSVSANRKRASQHLAIGVYIINRILHARLRIRILSSRYRVEPSKIKFVSARGHVISSIYPSCST